MTELLPKLGAGLAQAVLAGIALWASGKVGWGPAMAGLSVAQAALARAMGSTNGEAIALGVPGAGAGAGAFVMG